MKLTARQPGWIAQAPHTIEVVEHLSVPRDAVWDLLADNATWVDWFPGFRECAWIDETTGGQPNARRRVKQPPFEVHEVITAWEPPSLWAMSVEQINVGVVTDMAETVELEEVVGGTRITWRIGIAFASWARPFGPLLKADNRRKLRKAVNQLERLAAGPGER